MISARKPSTWLLGVGTTRIRVWLSVHVVALDSSATRRRPVRLFARAREGHAATPTLATSSGRWDPAAYVACDPDTATVCVIDGLNSSQARPQEFKFEAVFGPDANNAAVYDAVCSEVETLLADDAQETLCYLAYGHTGSGKTHTVFGSAADGGLAPRTARAMLRGGNKAPLELTFVEVYNDRVFDLLDGRAPRRVRRHSSTGRVFVEGLTAATLRKHTDWQQCCAAGLALRQTSATALNDRSSRSHALLTMRCRGVAVSFVDLAGSERNTTLHGPALDKDGIAINRSLSALSACIQRLATTGAATGFRDSLLTTLLQRYLTGVCGTSVIVCLHPSTKLLPETLSTLRYAQRLTNVTTSTAPPLPSPPPEEAPLADVTDASMASTATRGGTAEERAVAARIQQAQRNRIAALEDEVASLRSSLQSSAQTSLIAMSSGDSLPAPTSVTVAAAAAVSPPKHVDPSEPFAPDAAATSTEGVLALAEELRRTQLVSSHFSRQAASRPAEPCPQATVQCDDFFSDAFASTGRDVVAYVGIDVADGSSGDDADELECFFADFEMNAEAALALAEDSDTPIGDAGALAANLARWGLPPLYPLHPATAECSLGASTALSLHVTAVVELPADSVRRAPLRSWRCSCSAVGTVDTPTPFALVFSLPASAPSDVRDAVLREVGAVQRACTERRHKSPKRVVFQAPQGSAPQGGSARPSPTRSSSAGRRTSPPRRASRDRSAEPAVVPLPLADAAPLPQSQDRDVRVRVASAALPPPLAAAATPEDDALPNARTVAVAREERNRRNATAKQRRGGKPGAKGCGSSDGGGDGCCVA